MKAFRSLALPVIALALVHCTSTNNKIGLDALAKQTFTINTAADTSILTKDSIVFSFEKGSFDTQAGQVTITIQEALHLSDMLRAGLTTQADGDMLQSGGMFHITAEAGGQNVQLKKRAGVKLPTYKYRDGMNLYKGELKDGKLNWKAPEALLTREELAVTETGAKLFKSNCANCHKISGEGENTGPDLAYITERRCYQWLKQFTNNSTIMNDPIASCVKKRWKNSVMTAFMLTDAQNDSLYAYISTESKKYPQQQFFKNDPCLEINTKDTVNIREVTTETITTSEDFGKRKDTIPRSSGNSGPRAEEPLQYPTNNQYYEFTIETTGWFNIDMLLETDDGVQQGFLQLRINGSFTTRIQAYLVIPGRKVLSAGYTTDNQLFYFAKPDFTAMLPVGEQAVIYIMGEAGTQALWDSQTLTLSKRQTITLTPRGVPDIPREIEKLQIDKMEYRVKFKKTEIKYDIIERLYKANNCDGDGYWMADTSGIAPVTIPGSK